MIDNAKIRIDFHSAKEMERIFVNPLFEYKETTTTFTGEPIHHFDLRNLRVKLYPTLRFAILQNSFHKFRHGNNYSSFTYSDIRFVADYLKTIFMCSYSDLVIKSFEFAINIDTIEKPFNHFSKFRSIRKHLFYFKEPPYNHSTPLEIYCPFTTWVLKCYDTGKWNGLPNDIQRLRLEVKFIKISKVNEILKRNSKSLVTVKDFTDKYFLTSMSDFLIRTYQTIDKESMIDYGQFNPRQRDFLFAGLNANYWKNESLINTNTAKKKRTRYLQLKNQFAQNGIDEVETKLKEKFSYLISN